MYWIRPQAHFQTLHHCHLYVCSCYGYILIEWGCYDIHKNNKLQISAALSTWNMYIIQTMVSFLYWFCQISFCNFIWRKSCIQVGKMWQTRKQCCNICRSIVRHLCWLVYSIMSVILHLLTLVTVISVNSLKLHSC